MGFSDRVWRGHPEGAAGPKGCPRGSSRPNLGMIGFLIGIESFSSDPWIGLWNITVFQGICRRIGIFQLPSDPYVVHT